MTWIATTDREPTEEDGPVVLCRCPQGDWRPAFRVTHWNHATGAGHWMRIPPLPEPDIAELMARFDASVAALKQSLKQWMEGVE